MGKTRMLDGFKGTRRELLALLRDLHDGSATLAGATRLRALDAVCEVLADTHADAADTVLAGRVASALSSAIVRGGGVS